MKNILKVMLLTLSVTSISAHAYKDQYGEDSPYVNVLKDKNRTSDFKHDHLTNQEIIADFKDEIAALKLARSESLRRSRMFRTLAAENNPNAQLIRMSGEVHAEPAQFDKFPSLFMQQYGTIDVNIK